MKINTIYNENCLDTMSRMIDNFIDLTVTSPPYDNLRDYKGYSFDFESIAKELFRIIKKGGVVVWVVGDATINGSETGTSFKQALYFKEIGFNLHDTMIYQKTLNGCLGSNFTYLQNFEYMFVFSKGKPRAINLLKDRENKATQGKVKTRGHYKPNGQSDFRIIERKPFGTRSNIWEINPQKNSKHPATFPEKLAQDHIKTWSNESDLVYDPMCGSGTTLKMAHLLKRNWIGSEISKEYCELTKQRLDIKDTIQLKNPRLQRYIKIDRTNGIIISHKKTPGPYKNIPIIRHP